MAAAKVEKTAFNVRVGCGVFVQHPLKPSYILIGKRRGSSGDGEWALPGGLCCNRSPSLDITDLGHIEFGEELIETARYIIGLFNFKTMIMMIVITVVIVITTILFLLLLVLLLL